LHRRPAHASGRACDHDNFTLSISHQNLAVP
jgi:hypothetical protein